jgi:MarR family transcriptional regulator, 2-MHQ and catechol-resistance regulon repressor
MSTTDLRRLALPVHDDFRKEELDIMRRVAGLPVDELALAVASNIWRTAQVFKLKMEREILREHDLTFAGFSTLFIVWIWGPIETREIARSQAVTKATVTSTVSKLESQGFVKRRDSTIDRRLVTVELTGKGKRLIEWVFPKFNQGEVEVAKSLSEEEQDALAHLLRKVIRGMSNATQDEEVEHA